MVVDQILQSISQPLSLRLNTVSHSLSPLAAAGVVWCDLVDSFGRFVSLCFSPSLSPLLQELVELRTATPTAAGVVVTARDDLVTTS